MRATSESTQIWLLGIGWGLVITGLTTLLHFAGLMIGVGTFLIVFNQLELRR